MEIQEKHAGGRPPIYDASNEEDIAIVKGLCESYFDWIKGEYEDKSIYNPDSQKTETIQVCTRKPEPPTVTGLTLHIGFESKNTLYDYAKKPEFSDSIKRALTGIEKYHEIAAAYGDKCTGNIFVLKNFGWKDTISTEHSGEIKGGNTYDLSKLPTAALEALANAANDTSKD